MNQSTLTCSARRSEHRPSRSFQNCSTVDWWTGLPSYGKSRRDDRQINTHGTGSPMNTLAHGFTVIHRAYRWVGLKLPAARSALHVTGSVGSSLPRALHSANGVQSAQGRARALCLVRTLWVRRWSKSSSETSAVLVCLPPHGNAHAGHSSLWKLTNRF